MNKVILFGTQPYDRESFEQLRDAYDERIFSRLVDRNNTFVAQLSDGDKRILTR